MKGHIYKREKTWTYVVDLGRDPITNKRMQKTKGGFRIKRDAEAAMNDVLTSINRGEFIMESSISLKDFIEEWLQLYQATGKVKTSTIAIRKYEISKINGYFKTVKIRDVNVKMYQDFLITSHSSLADRTIQGIHSTASMVFKKAVEMRYIRSNPTVFAVLPKKKKTVEELENETEIPKFFEKDELKTFLEAAKKNGQSTYCMFCTLAYTGMRVGELSGLKWKDIDFKNQEIKIFRTNHIRGKTVDYELLTPKTKSSKRTIVIDKSLVKELKKHKALQNKLILQIPSWLKEDFVFTNVITFPGYPESTRQIGTKMKKVLKLSGLKTELSPHGLRHTHASLLAYAGVGLNEIMDRLGHINDKTTRNIYLHVTAKKKEEAAQKFRELMNS
jgi:integrase